MCLSLALPIVSGLHISMTPSFQQLALCHSARSGAAVMEDQQCAMIDLMTDDPLRLAKTLKKAWMEGAVKRGLVGSVLVPSENVVTIVAMGPRKRLDSFAEWIETSSQLVSKVTYDADSCPSVELNSKFELAESDQETSSPWRELLEQATVDVRESEGKLHSSDEGLA